MRNPPSPAGGKTVQQAPPMVFDAHLHIIDSRFPLVANNGYLPPPFTCADYLERMKGNLLAGGAVISGSFQAFDQAYLVDALERLGAGFVGVTQLPASVSDQQLYALDAARIRAVRFNIRRGGSEDLRHMELLARRVHDVVGWHVELYIDARELEALYGKLVALPALSIDHLGLSQAGLPSLLRLAERGVRVKACGFGRVDFDVATALRDLYAANPACLMFGSDLPSTGAPRPYLEADLQLVAATFDAQAAQRVLCDNARDFYRIAPAAEIGRRNGH